MMSCVRGSSIFFATLFVLRLAFLSSSLPPTAATGNVGAGSGSRKRRLDGDAAFRAGDLQLAEKHYRHALAEDRDDVQALSNLGTVLYHHHLLQDNNLGSVGASPSSVAAEIAEISELYRRARLRPTGKVRQPLTSILAVPC